MPYAVLRSTLFTFSVLAGLALAGCGTTLNIVGNDGGDEGDTGVDPSDTTPSTDTGSAGTDSSPIDAASCVGPNKHVCGTACVDVSTSSSNCGSCGKSCPSGSVCESGVCTCAAGLVKCDGGCKDLSKDSSACGSCTNACSSGATCISGSCECTAGSVKCPSGKCVDVASDDFNCGGCGIVCTGAKCISGSCTCSGGKTMCSGTCVDLERDTLNCGACGTPCAGVCASGHCSVPTCRSAAPKVLFYGPLGSMEKPYLPVGAISVVATETMWRAMTTTDFAGYDLIVLGAPDATTTTGSSEPKLEDYVAAFDTRATWGAAIDGRIAVLGMDPAFHAMKGVAGASLVLRSTLTWLTTSVPGTTALYVNSDWGTRNLDFLSPFGAFASTADLYTDTVNVTTSTHPILAGSTDATLSSWGSSAHSFVTAPSGFATLATGTDTFSTPPTGPVFSVRDAATCTP